MGHVTECGPSRAKTLSGLIRLRSLSQGVLSGLIRFFLCWVFFSVENSSPDGWWSFKIYLMASENTRHCVTTFIFMLWFMVSELICGGVITHSSQCSFIPQCSKERVARVASRPLLSGFKVAQRLLPGRWKVHRLFWFSAPAFALFTFRRT